jgi:phospholipid-binding lipoprotein MlaA
VLPFLGGTNMRDMFDPIIANQVMNPSTYAISKNTRLAITASKIVHERSVILPFSDYITKTSVDPYASVRSALFQSREKMLNYPTYYRCRHD